MTDENPMNTTQTVWDGHYTRPKAKLAVPDENVVRYFAKWELSGRKILDFGAGSGRNGIYLQSMGFDVYFTDYSPESLELIRTALEESPTQLAGSFGDGLTSSATKSAEIDRVFQLRENGEIPLGNASFDGLLAWGVLHYNDHDARERLVQDWHRILKPGGRLLTSIRSNKDTHLQAKQNTIGLTDLQSAYIHLFSEKEIRELLEPYFSIRLGYMERTILGEPQLRICHHIVEAIPK